MAFGLPLVVSSAPAGASTGHALPLFIADIALMLLAGRVLGEVMHRLRQPAVLGQLLAGIVIGPTGLGALWPSAYRTLFEGGEQSRMVDGVAQFGVLLLLFLSGMEVDVELVSRMRRTAALTSASGIVVPFALGITTGLFLPADLLPDPARRIATALFLATCLSVSSVKIVAMVIMESGAARRNVGQMILGTAILDDTVGWILVGLTSGISARGATDLVRIGVTVVLAAAFVVLAWTVGRGAVAKLIQVVNDRLRTDFAVVSFAVMLMCALSLLTDAIGVHTALGAFTAGVLVGQSPIRSRHIGEQLRGVVVAFFAPVFFTVAGRSTDFRILGQPELVTMAVIFIGIASLGKLAGGYAGGRLGRLPPREAMALAFGMNARGSTEVVVAAIGLSLGVLSQSLYTLLVLTALVTTMSMPPLLRWSLRRLEPTGEEKERLEREAAEAKEFVPNVERVLLLLGKDDADRGVAASLAGLFAAARSVPLTVVDLTPDGTPSRGGISRRVEVAWRTAARGDANKPNVTVTSPGPDDDVLATVLEESQKGYELLFANASRDAPGPFVSYAALVHAVAAAFPGVSAIAVGDADESFHPRRILVPTEGTDYGKRAAEIAIAIAKATDGRLTCLHVARWPLGFTRAWRRRPRLHDAARATVDEIADLGRREGVPVHREVTVRRTADVALADALHGGAYDLVVLGAKLSQGDILFFGETAEVVVEKATCPVLLVKS